MKKLMFMLAAVAIAATTQAASVWWTCTNVKENGSGVSGIAYFMTTDFMSIADAQALAGTGATAVSAALDGYYSFSGSAGGFGVTSANAVNQTNLKLVGGTTYDAYLIVFDTATITDASNFYITGTKTLLAQEGATDVGSVKWGSQATPSAADGAWRAVNVPEPTSGLLMLVGLAGLALRRRRA